MLDDNSISFNHEGNNGVALVWTIDGDCLYDLPLSIEHANIFLNTNNVIDISIEYPDLPGITLALKQNDILLEKFYTSQYFGSILLSNPIVLKLSDYPYGRYVESPNAKFDGEKFIITNRDITNYLP